MMLLERYIATRGLQASLNIWLGLTTLLAVFGCIDELDALKQAYDGIHMLLYIGQKLPILAFNIFPTACLIGTMIAVGAMMAQSEFAIIRCNGIGLCSIVIWSILPLVLVAGVLVVLYDSYFIGWHQQAETTRDKLRKNIPAPDYASISKTTWLKENNAIISVGSVASNGTVRNIHVWYLDPATQNLTKFVTAERGTLANGEIILDHGREVSLSSHSMRWAKINKIPLTTDQQTMQWLSVRTPEYLTMQNLYRITEYLNTQQLNSNTFGYALWQRALFPISIVVLVVFAVGLVAGPLRGTPVSTRIFVSVLVGILIQFVLQLLGSISVVFSFDPLLFVSVPMAVIFAVGCWFFMRHNTG